ncbi:MAG: hypothetical protein ACJA2W_003374 [Planctomycetota bacterium]|jgi:uncharacterized protein (DUF1330 family)
MTVYLIADIKLTNEDWVPAYATHVHDIFGRYGGKYLARSGNVQTIEGEGLDTSLLTILEFPSKDAVTAFSKDAEYAPHARARQAGSISRFHVVDGSDLAGTIPYLPGAE